MLGTASLGAVDAFTADDQGTLYVLNGANQLSTLNRDTGEVTAIGAVPGYAAVEGLAFHDGRLYAAASVNAEKYGIDLGYDEAADQQSWQAMQDLFEQVF